METTKSVNLTIKDDDETTVIDNEGEKDSDSDGIIDTDDFCPSTSDGLVGYGRRIAGGSGIFMTEDGGVSWTNINNNIYDLTYIFFPTENIGSAEKVEVYKMYIKRRSRLGSLLMIRVLNT